MKHLHLLYPSSPLRSRQPDEQFAAEVDAVRSVGFEVSLFSLENFQNGRFLTVPPLPAATDVLYRGWMLSAEEYGAFVVAIADAGSTPVTDLPTYLATHHLPNWFAALADLTPETRIYPPDCDLEAELRALGWAEFFIKDYVKSLKTSVGSRISKPEQVAAVVADMKCYRGVIEGGFCVRQVEAFLPDTERRYFVVKGVPHTPSGDVPAIVRECVQRLRSRFYSVDVVQRSDGQLRIVEVGDGQVSDLAGWSPGQFARVLAEHFVNKAPTEKNA